MHDFINLKIVFILTVGFTIASILGYFSHRIKFSPILGYLLAGYFIGPYSPGLVADITLAEQLAEIGVILMMFGVGLHFKWKDLINVKNIALPGAIGQIIITSLIVILFVLQIGWTLQAGMIFGLAIGVTSTVVLIRVLSESNLINTLEGHISVGWLIVEDIITVLAILLVPSLARSLNGEAFSPTEFLISTISTLLKFTLLTVLMFTFGQKLIKYLLSKVVKTNSAELFILSVLTIIFLIAMGATLLFGISIALGAFLSGMVIGQTRVRHHVADKMIPLKDIFMVIFFLSIGMLFNPRAIAEEPLLFCSMLAIVLLIKPLVAFLIVWALRYPFRIAFTIAVALAQIGEFSFILAEAGTRLSILPESGYDIIVGCALVSISLNPLFFKLLKLSKATES